jgi:hypothetical protein
LWLDIPRKHSTLDWFDLDFTVVAGPEGDAWLEAGKSVSESLNLRLSLRKLPHAHPADGIQMGPRGAVLVRPDGHVAMRVPYMPAEPGRVLADALSTLLH